MNQTLLPWLLAGDVDLVLEELKLSAFFNQEERDKIKALMLRINNHEKIIALRKEKDGLI